MDNFTLLPKINKKTFNVPCRPVISNTGTATEKNSAFLGFYLKPVIQTIPHVLEDTAYFWRRLSYLQKIPENSILVSFDVVGICPNIPHEEVTDIMGALLNERSNRQISTANLCRLAKIILKET